MSRWYRKEVNLEEVVGVWGVGWRVVDGWAFVGFFQWWMG